MIICEYNPITNKVRAIERGEETVAWFATAVSAVIYFFAEIAPLED